jgi:hypothetical protein
VPVLELIAPEPPGYPSDLIRAYRLLLRPPPVQGISKQAAFGGNQLPHAWRAPCQGKVDREDESAYGQQGCP